MRYRSIISDRIANDTWTKPHKLRIEFEVEVRLPKLGQHYVVWDMKKRRSIDRGPNGDALIEGLRKYVEVRTWEMLSFNATVTVDNDYKMT